jgi:glycosyltransferase involved in cell wall biosynthesis
MNSVPVSVIVRTFNRPALLDVCLRSIIGCHPPADEVIVVDQSSDARSLEVANRMGEAVRHVPLKPPNRATAFNVALAEARNDLVMMTDDDCSVAPNWVDAGLCLARLYPGAIITGQVKPVGDPRRVPSTIQDPVRRVYTGELHSDKLYPNNMIGPRTALLGLGGFDPRLPPAEDNDLCYRWLADDRPLIYDPCMVVSHHDWREPAALRELYRSYARGQGVLYAKHLRGGDLRVLRFLVRDMLSIPRGFVARRLRGRPAWSDGRAALLRNMPRGLWDGWKRYG